MKRSPRGFLAALAGLPLAVVIGMAACNSVSGVDDLSFTAKTCATGADCDALGCTTSADCPIDSFCDANACKPKLPHGVACTSSEACASDSCADGVCCDSACTGTCKSCNQAGPNKGVCLPVLGYMPDLDTCSANRVCSADGICGFPNGQPSTDAATCASGHVADGVCCDAPCYETCKACNIPGKVGTCDDLDAGQSEPTGCVAPNVCNGAGDCRKSMGMACGEPDGLPCENGSTCVDGYCCNESCESTCHACNVAGALGYCVLVPFDMPDPGTCEGSMRCDSLGQCKDMAGKLCSTDTDCLNGNCVDGFCCSSFCNETCTRCSSSGQCVNVLAYQADPDTCTGGMVCDGAGACKQDNGASCTMVSDCVSGFCVDGVCCESECTGACKACNLAGSLGQCGNLPANTQDTCGPTSKCNGYGACYKADGEQCTQKTDCLSGHCVDGICCATACAAICKACSAAKTGGENGVCGNVKVNTDPDDECSYECSGAGACEFANGSACTAVAQCQSGNCVDGYCCDTVCAGTCMACSATKTAGANGTCGDIKWNTDPDTECPFECNGAGGCELADGAACTLAWQCQSGNCVDGVCCNSVCTEVCKACSAAKTGGADGTCGNVKVNTDPDTECPFECNGAGACEFANGSACTAVAQCESGNCVDGVCCNEACGESCKACNLPGQVGQCKYVPPNQPDDTCILPRACNGMGGCLKGPGESCGAANECLSNFCADGVCCNEACGDTCKACNLAGQIGTCAYVSQNDTDTGTCESPQACDGGGACKAGNNSPCIKNDECASGNCANQICAP